MHTVLEAIEQDIQDNDIVLFMKGTASMPQCGFSAIVVQILKGQALNFKDVNVLTDPDVRQGIKDYSNWPTIPQLFIKGEFIGGCDIVREMHESGELKELLIEKGLISA
jgi:monothiol glutaredoxin